MEIVYRIKNVNGNPRETEWWNTEDKGKNREKKVWKKLQKMNLKNRVEHIEKYNRVTEVIKVVKQRNQKNFGTN